MLEYPTILPSARAPRKAMIAFDKLDGSNIRVKWTAKRGFHLFGSRTQLVDATHTELGGAMQAFARSCEQPLGELLRRRFAKEKEVIAFGEYLGPNSFAGVHTDDVAQMRFVLFDLLIVRKQAAEFLLPQEFLKLLRDTEIEIPRVVYEGNLGPDFIERVRNNEFDLNEGVVCKGRERSNACFGKVWMSKIKTLQYRQRLCERYGDDWSRYWE